MDTAINNGDFQVDSRGKPIVLSGFEEVLQRIMIRVKTKLGSFVYDKNLGSEIYTLKDVTENLNDKALAIVRRAIVDMCGVTADSAKVSRVEDKIIIKICVSSGEESGEVELTI